MAVDWAALRSFIGECDDIETWEDFGELLDEAESLNEPTQALAVEHLYLHEPDDNEKSASVESLRDDLAKEIAANGRHTDLAKHLACTISKLVR